MVKGFYGTKVPYKNLILPFTYFIENLCQKKQSKGDYDREKK